MEGEMILLKLYMVCGILIVFAFAQQSVEEMMKQMQQQVNQEIQKNEEAVRKFISKDDSLFAEFLKNDWKPFEPEKGREKEELPKPVKIPEIPESEVEFEEIEPIVVELPEDDIDTTIDPEIIPREIKIPKDKSYTGLIVPYFGQKLKIQYDPEIKINVRQPVNDKSIQKYWNNMSQVNIKPMIGQIESYTQLYKLNDYGKYLLVKKVADEILNTKDDKVLYCWYVMIKMGYDVKIGYGRNFTSIMIPTNNMLYSRPYLTFDGQKYFIFTYDDKKGNPLQLYSYDKSHPTASKFFDFSIKELPMFGEYNQEKELKFKYHNEVHIVNYVYNENLIKYFNNYPQTDYPVYFNAPVSPKILYSFVKSFKPIIENKPEQEALNIILRFVQTAFEYKTDDDHFGREKPLIPDETFYYQYSDCEDRSILFSTLVREMLSLKVVGLKYKGHMAVGVKTKTKAKGDHISAGNNRYLVCDPTYINANIGQCMPQYKNTSIQVIDY